MLELFKTNGKDKISKIAGKINSLIVDLEDGVKEVHAEKAAKEQSLKDQKALWKKQEAEITDEIASLTNAAEIGAKLKVNMENLIK